MIIKVIGVPSKFDWIFGRKESFIKSISLPIDNLEHTKDNKVGKMDGLTGRIVVVWFDGSLYNTESEMLYPAELGEIYQIKVEEGASIKEKIEGNMETYYQMSDGTWICGEFTYQFRLEISGRMPNGAKDSTFVYLNNQEEITLEQAWKASGLSSSMSDYFSPADAVLVDME